MSNFERMTLAEQLGNVGSEVGRAESAREKGDNEKEMLAAERALNLLDRTIADERWRHRLKEIVRAREVLADYFFGTNSYNTKNLNKYFYQFALAARLSR